MNRKGTMIRKGTHFVVRDDAPAAVRAEYGHMRPPRALACANVERGQVVFWFHNGSETVVRSLPREYVERAYDPH